MKFTIDYVLKLTDGRQYGVHGSTEDGVEGYFNMFELKNAIDSEVIEPDNFIYMKSGGVKGKAGHALVFKDLLSWDEVYNRYNKCWVNLDNIVWKVRKGGSISYCTVVRTANSNEYWEIKKSDTLKGIRSVWRWIEHKNHGEVGVVGATHY